MNERLTFDHYCVCTKDGGVRWELGRGAMGVTFKAEDVNLLCPVALKVIDLSSDCEDQTRMALAAEARAAARLRHRNVASVYHLGMDAAHMFYAMEFVEGETVQAFVDRCGPVPPGLALRMVRQVARALGAAHRQGIVHRDIKPSNLMISTEHPDDEDGAVVKVIDFGLAHPVEACAGRGFFGTPHFASPEQAAELEVDTRSDIYSLGCTLWFLLTGKPPLEGALAQIMTRKLSGDLPWEDLRGHGSSLRQLLRIMLRSDPEERPRDPQQLLAAVEICLRSVELSHTLPRRMVQSAKRMNSWLLTHPRRKAFLATSFALSLLIAASLALPSTTPSAVTGISQESVATASTDARGSYFPGSASPSTTVADLVSTTSTTAERIEKRDLEDPVASIQAASTQKPMPAEIAEVSPAKPASRNHAPAAAYPQTAIAPTEGRIKVAFVGPERSTYHHQGRHSFSTVRRKVGGFLARIF